MCVSCIDHPSHTGTGIPDIGIPGASLANMLARFDPPDPTGHRFPPPFLGDTESFEPCKR